MKRRITDKEWIAAKKLAVSSLSAVIFVSLIMPSFASVTTDVPALKTGHLPPSSERHQVAVIAPKGGQALLNPFFRPLLKAIFGIEVRREARELEVFVLIVPAGKTASLPPSQVVSGGARLARGQIQAQKQPLSTLAGQLENMLGRTVVDETGLKAEYDWELPFSYQDRQVLITVLRERLGLELIEAKRPVEVLVMEKAESVRGA